MIDLDHFLKMDSDWFVDPLPDGTVDRPKLKQIYDRLLKVINDE